MASTGADGIGFVIDVFAVVALEIGFIEQSLSSAMCSHTLPREDHVPSPGVFHSGSPQVSALVGPY